MTLGTHYTPVKVHTLTCQTLPVHINTSQYDQHGTTPILEPFQEATTLEHILQATLARKTPPRFKVTPNIHSDTVTATISDDISTALNDNNLTLTILLAPEDKAFINEVTRKGMSAVIFGIIESPENVGRPYTIQAKHVIATGGNTAKTVL